MTDYNGIERLFEYEQGLKERGLAAESASPALFAVEEAEITRPIFDGQFDFPSFISVWIVNRGKNGGAGPTFVYWISPNSIDLTGAYYTGLVPFWQLSDIVGTGSFVG